MTLWQKSIELVSELSVPHGGGLQERQRKNSGLASKMPKARWHQLEEQQCLKDDESGPSCISDKSGYDFWMPRDVATPIPTRVLFLFFSFFLSSGRITSCMDGMSPDKRTKLGQRTCETFRHGAHKCRLCRPTWTPVAKFPVPVARHVGCS